MVIERTAAAGMAEKNDALVTVSPCGGEGIEVDLVSIVKLQFGDRLIRVAKEYAGELGVTSAHIRIEDQGALDYVIRARLETAVMRAQRGDGI